MLCELGGLRGEEKSDAPQGENPTGALFDRRYKFLWPVHGQISDSSVAMETHRHLAALDDGRHPPLVAV